MMRRARHILSGVVFWCGIAVVFIISLPAELLFAIVSVTVNALDAIIKKIDGGS